MGEWVTSPDLPKLSIPRQPRDFHVPGGQEVAGSNPASPTNRENTDALNTEAVPTARGGRWYASTVRAVLDSLALDALAVTA